jgi:rubrerythrin
MQNESRSRACREGWLGRKRTYRCRICGEKFRVDTLNPLPEDKRMCPVCRARQENKGE